MPATISTERNPVNGRQTVSTTAILLTQITKTGSNTTFTNKTVTDGSGLDLSDVQEGYVLKVTDAVTGDEYRAIVASVDDNNDEITVQGWKLGGMSGKAKAAMKPADGSIAYILKTDKCKRLLVDAIDTNSADVFIGFESTVTIGSGSNPGHPIASSPTQPNHRFDIKAELPDVIDLGNTYVITTGTQYISYVAM